MEIPNIYVKDENGDLVLVFREEEFERPHLFLDWFHPISKRIVLNFIGQRTSPMLILMIQEDLQNALRMQIYKKNLWQDLFTRKWDFNKVEDPNILLKELI